MANSKALGRGLGALLPGAERPPSQDPPTSLPVEKIRPNPVQPRRSIDPELLDSLAESIRVHGIIQPLVVRPAGEGYEIIAGERRWRAARSAGLKEVPVRVLVLNESQSVQAALVENLQREDLHPLEVADGIRDLITRFSISHEEAARRLGWSRTAVTNKLRLLGLPDSVKARIASGSLSEGHARALLGLDDPLRVEKYAERVEREGLSVRQAEALVQREKDRSPVRPVSLRRIIPLSPDMRSYSREKGFRLALSRKASGVAVTLEGLTETQANRLLDLIRTVGDDVFLREED
jgi:ParB family chromosome partitioning protein